MRKVTLYLDALGRCNIPDSYLAGGVLGGEAGTSHHTTIVLHTHTVYFFRMACRHTSGCGKWCQIGMANVCGNVCTTLSNTYLPDASAFQWTNPLLHPSIHCRTQKDLRVSGRGGGEGQN